VAARQFGLCKAGEDEAVSVQVMNAKRAAGRPGGFLTTIGNRSCHFGNRRFIICTVDREQASKPSR
jgi:hypothetical protein